MDSYRGCKYGFRYSLLRKNGCSILYGCCSYFVVITFLQKKSRYFRKKAVID